jgi:predicted O-methyltransferase YrrM
MARTHTQVTEEVAAYLRMVTLNEPEALRRQRESTESHPSADLQTSPEQGQFLHLLARAANARKTLDVGVFLGASSTWVALALPEGGKVVACDRNAEFAEQARQLWRGAGVEAKIELRLGPALESLDALIAEGQAGTFDFAFIDADKTNYAAYYDRAIELVRPGGLIVADNVLWHGRLTDPEQTDDDTEAIRAYNRKLRADARVATSIVPLGDGLSVACKL